MDKRYVYKKVQYAVYAGEVAQSENKAQPICDWSPNNLRKLILSPEGVVVQWYTVIGTKHKTKTQLTLFKDENETLGALLGAPHNFLKILSQHHKFSNIEEIVVLPTSPSRPGLSLDTEQIFTSLDIKSFPRLANLIVGVEPMSLKDFVGRFKATINKPTELLGNVVTPDLFSVKQLNMQYYNSISLRGFYYSLDENELSKHLRSIKKKFEANVDNIDVTQTQSKEALDSIIARNNLLNPLLDDALAGYLFLLKNKDLGVLPELPVSRGFFGLTAEKPKGLAMLKKAGLLTETPGSNIELLNGLYTNLKKCVDELLLRAGLEEIYNLEGMGIKEYLPKAKNELLPLFVNSKKVLKISRAHDYQPLEPLAFDQLTERVLVAISEDPLKTQKIWNSFVVLSKLTGVTLSADAQSLSREYEVLPREWREYIGYNILLNSSKPELYASQEEPRLLQLTAVPSKHYKLESTTEGIDKELKGSLDLRETYDFTQSPEGLEFDLEAKDPSEVVSTDTVLNTASDDIVNQELNAKAEEKCDVGQVSDLSDKQKRLLDDFRALPLHLMWKGMRLNETVVDTFIDNIGKSSNVECAMSELVVLIDQLKSTGPGVLAYMRDVYGLGSSITAVGSLKYSGISDKTVGFITLRGKETTWEDITLLGQKLLKDEV